MSPLGRLTQRESDSFTRNKSGVQSPHRPPGKRPVASQVTGRFCVDHHDQHHRYCPTPDSFNRSSNEAPLPPDGAGLGCDGAAAPAANVNGYETLTGPPEDAGNAICFTAAAAQLASWSSKPCPIADPTVPSSSILKSTTIVPAALLSRASVAS